MSEDERRRTPPRPVPSGYAGVRTRFAIDGIEQRWSGHVLMVMTRGRGGSAAGPLAVLSAATGGSFITPLRGKTTDWRAGCGRSARPVRREGELNSIGSPYPYQPPSQGSVGPNCSALPGHGGETGICTSGLGSGRAHEFRQTAPLPPPSPGARVTAKACAAEELHSPAVRCILKI